MLHETPLTQTKYEIALESRSLRAPRIKTFNYSYGERGVINETDVIKGH